MATQRIKLKKAAGTHKADAVITATPEAIASHGLEVGKDYDPLGTLPHPAKSQLAMKSKAKPKPKTSAKK